MAIGGHTMSNKNGNVVVKGLNINGFTNKVDILTSIKENISDSNFLNATDKLEQLIKFEEKELYGTKEEAEVHNMLELANEMSMGK